MTKQALFLAIFLSLPLVSFASIDANLKYGSIGTEVSELQEFLVTKGFLTTNPTGNFYSLTLAAVKSYQASVNVPNTGFVGPMTRGAINAELANDLQGSNNEEASLPPAPAPVPPPAPAPSPVPTPSPTPVFGNTPTTISIGQIDCHGASGQLSEYGVTVPVAITGDYKTWRITYDGLVQTLVGNNGRDAIVADSNRVISYVTASHQDSSGKMSTSGFIPNISTTYHMTAHAYDAMGKDVATSGEQIVTVDCPASPYFTIR